MQKEEGIFDVEIVEEDDVQEHRGEIIKLAQKPVILYDALKQKGQEIEQRLAELSLDTLEVSENNLKVVKSIRADIRKEFEQLEDRRKYVKDEIMKPYLDFEALYKEFIKSKYEGADRLLKEKIDTVETELLQKKEAEIRKYFEESNPYDFLKFEDLELKILKSKSLKHYRELIDSAIKQVESDLETIQTLPNSDRVLAKYKLTKDLNHAISEVQREVAEEKRIQEQRQKQEEERRRREEAQREAERQRIEREKQEEAEYIASVAPHLQEKAEEKKEEIFTARFEVQGTMEQLKELKKFLVENGYQYKNI